MWLGSLAGPGQNVVGLSGRPMTECGWALWQAQDRMWLGTLAGPGQNVVGLSGRPRAECGWALWQAQDRMWLGLWEAQDRMWLGSLAGPGQNVVGLSGRPRTECGWVSGPGQAQAQAQALTLVGVDSLQVHDVADDVILVGDAVPPQHVSGLPGDIQRFATAVPLQHGDHLRGCSGFKHRHESVSSCSIRELEQISFTFLFPIFLK